MKLYQMQRMVDFQIVMLREMNLAIAIHQAWREKGMINSLRRKIIKLRKNRNK